MEPRSTFEISAVGNRARAEDWLRAGQVAESDALARDLRARGELAKQLADQRVLDRVKKFGLIVAKLLNGLSGHYKLLGVTARLEQARWIVRVQTDAGEARVAIDERLASNVVDSGALQDLDLLKIELEKWLGRVDLISPTVSQ